MKNITLIALISLVAPALSAQTPFMTESFTKINISTSAKVYLQPDTAYWIDYTGDDILSKKVNVYENTLEIHEMIDDAITIHFSQLDEVVLKGEGTVIGKSKIKTNELHLQIKGGGKMEMNVEVVKINAEIDGLGKIVLSGTAQESNFSIPGSGKIDAEDMKTITCNAKISGLGKCIVDPIDQLNATITGNGSIIYKTTPKELNKNITGLGSIKSMSGGGTSSSSSSSNDTTKLEFGKSQFWVIGDKDEFHIKKRKTTKPIWAGFEYGLNTYLDNGGTFTLDPSKEPFELHVEKSEYVSINFFQQQVELGNSNLWLFSGLGFSWNNYRFDSDVIVENGNYTTAYHDTSNIAHVKSKLVACYLTAPVMLEYFTDRKIKNAFHIGVGGMFGLRIDSYTKLKFEDNDVTTKVHSHDDFNLNTFRYGFRLAMGYGRFNVFADYYASTLFKDNKGPVLYPASIGITVVGF